MTHSCHKAVIDGFKRRFGEASELSVFSSPGRVEIGGNHTDHQGGNVLAAAIDLDILAVAAPSKSLIQIDSEGFGFFTVGLENLAPLPEEAGTPQALVRGICARMQSLGYKTGGFSAFMKSSIPGGSGLSSSAAFSMLVCTILSQFYSCGTIHATILAQIAQFAENKYFDKPCGLMDQLAISTGGFTAIDFADPTNPVIIPVAFDFSATMHSLCVVNTDASHADLTEAYASIPQEMGLVARAMGKERLADVSPADFYSRFESLRGLGNDRALLRAIHFFDETQRVKDQTLCLQENRFNDFLALVNASGHSSFMNLQNIYPPDSPATQPLAIALALSGTILGNRGTFRVHGGGFAGSILAIVPNALLATYQSAMNAALGIQACRELALRSKGTCFVEKINT